MSRLFQSVVCLAVTAFFLAQAQNATGPVAAKILPTTSNLMPPLLTASPVTFFRELLAMSPGERVNTLTNRSPEARSRILAKVREYQELNPDERELRLRATELHWWLTPLLRMAPADRAGWLAQVPEELRGLVQSRLMQWDVLPPPLQQEFLANDQTLHYFARVPMTNDLTSTPAQQKISEQFGRFFDLTPVEKQQTLRTLPNAERVAMERTLQSFGRLPPQQQSQCVRNYAKFAGMSAAERAKFLKSAERWSKMSPEERKTWRDLVAQVPIWPQLPPLPPPVPSDLIPHNPPKLPRPNVATNLN